MPDFERFADELREKLASNDGSQAYESGFTAGKSYARKEIAYLAVFAAGIIILMALFA